jgi:hypothetical protein
MAVGSSGLIRPIQADPPDDVAPNESYYLIKLVGGQAFVARSWPLQELVAGPASLVVDSVAESTFLPDKPTRSLHAVKTVHLDEPLHLGVSVNLTDWLPARGNDVVKITLNYRVTHGAPIKAFVDKLQRSKLDAALSLVNPGLAVAAKVTEIVGQTLSALLPEGEQTEPLVMPMDLNVAQLQAGYYAVLASQTDEPWPDDLRVSANGTSLTTAAGAPLERLSYALILVLAAPSLGVEALRDRVWVNLLQTCVAQAQSSKPETAKERNAALARWRSEVMLVNLVAQDDHTVLRSEIDAVIATAQVKVEDHLGVSHAVEKPADYPQALQQVLGATSPTELREKARASQETLARTRNVRTLARVSGQTEAGRTEHVVAFSDGRTKGDATANAILGVAEAIYAELRDKFGGIDLPSGQEGDDITAPRTATPIYVLIDPQAGGGYHFGCDATDIYLLPDPDLADAFFTAELVEVFAAAAGSGWDCGHTNGQALSVALACEQSATLATAYLAPSVQGWWKKGHADYVTQNTATDQDWDANGCGTLFMYYLHSQLGYEWPRITAAGGATLGECYQHLTGKSPAQGFTDFIQLLNSLANRRQLQLPSQVNPFPVQTPTS